MQRCKNADVLKLQTQALAAQREEACKAYTGQVPALFQDLENGLFSIFTTSPDVQKRWRQAWRRSWEKALNKAIVRYGYIIVYKGNSPAFVEAIVETEKTETTADKMSAFLETLALSPECKSRVIALINLDLEKADTIGDLKKADLAKAV